MLDKLHVQTHLVKDHLAELQHYSSFPLGGFIRTTLFTVLQRLLEHA